IEAGKMTIERTRCSPSQIIRDVVSLMRVRASEKQLELAVEFTNALPDAIESDPTRLRQILVNLVGNAVKFTERGSVRILARCDTAESAQPRLAIEVADTGVGMSKHELSNLFQAFLQADSSTTRRFGGSGLGLAISQRLAAMLGGEIAVESLPGRGS